MDEQFSDELTSPVITPKPKSNSSIILLFITIFLLMISIAVIIVLIIKLNNKSKKYDDLKEKYSRQNNTLNNIFEDLLTLISNASISHTKINKENYENIRDIVNNFTREHGEGIYNLDLDKNDTQNFSEGYQVSFENSLKFSDKDYDNIVYTLSCLIGSDANIRVYKNDSKISFHVSNLNISFSLAALFNQESFLVCNSSEEILNPFYQPKCY